VDDFRRAGEELGATMPPKVGHRPHHRGKVC
jgi:hypothetical protein